MQLYAWDQSKRIISADKAERHTDYICMECEGRIRLRGGVHRQYHFFHLDNNIHCHQNGKGMIHLQVQLHLLQLFGKDCQLEYRFPEINRIADVAWIPHKIIFEIQYSSIEANEVHRRNESYQKLGWQVVWILHDRRYNKKLVSAAESFLRLRNYYYTNIDASGKGCIYDQFDIISLGVRKYKLAPLNVNLKQYEVLGGSSKALSTLRLISERRKQWNFSFHGDLVSCEDVNYLTKAKEIEKKNESTVIDRKTGRAIIDKILIRPYLLLLQYFVEKMCR